MSAGWSHRAIASLTLVLGVVVGLSCSPEQAAHIEGPGAPDELGRASSALLAPDLTGVHLGMAVSELNKARPRAARQPGADEPGVTIYDEMLPTRGRALYVFSSVTSKLIKVQLATELASVRDIAPRLATQQARFGVASGVWDCPGEPQGLPTRRFSWTRGQVGVMDTYLILGEHVAATLYVAPRSALVASLEAAKCTPTPEGRIAQFPVPQPDP